MKILQNRLRFSVGVQYKPSTVIREQVGTDGARATCGLLAGDEQVRGAAELLVDAACVDRHERQVIFTCVFFPLA